MISFKYLLFIGFFFHGLAAVACNSKTHHSVLSHYNHAQKVFEGKVIKVGKAHKKNFSFLYKESNIRSVFVKFEVIKTYKNCVVKEELVVGVLPDVSTMIELGAHYIVYANAQVGYDFLLCERSFNMADVAAIKRQEYLLKMPQNHSGYLVEYSEYGQKWAEGKLEDGLAVGVWKYYAKSGELQIQGQYKKGEEDSLWCSYYHTADENYKIFQEIQTGLYFKKTGSYQTLRVDSNRIGVFNKQLVYLVGTDTIVEEYYYNEPLLAKSTDYKNGFRTGEELSYNEMGQCISRYIFEGGLLDGPFWVLQTLATQKKTYLRVEGDYKADEKYNERHLYYENNMLDRTRVILKKGKLLF